MTKKCFWSRYIYNGYEPDNKIIFYGIETDFSGRFVADELSFAGVFNDGRMSCLITKIDRGKYRAIVDGKKTYCGSFEEAWEKMPAFLTHPDHFDESEIVVYEE